MAAIETVWSDSEPEGEEWIEGALYGFRLEWRAGRRVAVPYRIGRVEGDAAAASGTIPEDPAEPSLDDLLAAYRLLASLVPILADRKEYPLLAVLKGMGAADGPGGRAVARLERVPGLGSG